mgnify:CR=1 FL=1
MLLIILFTSFLYASHIYAAPGKCGIRKFLLLQFINRGLLSSTKKYKINIYRGKWREFLGKVVCVCNDDVLKIRWKYIRTTVGCYPCQKNKTNYIMMLNIFHDVLINRFLCVSCLFVHMTMHLIYCKHFQDEFISRKKINWFFNYIVTYILRHTSVKFFRMFEISFSLYTHNNKRNLCDWWWTRAYTFLFFLLFLNKFRFVLFSHFLIMLISVEIATFSANFTSAF